MQHKTSKLLMYKMMKRENNETAETMKENNIQTYAFLNLPSVTRCTIH